MAFLNYFLQFKTFADKNPSNSPNLTLINWIRDVQGVSVENQAAQVLTIAPNSTISVFSAANKKFLYLEADLDLQLKINGSSDHMTVSPVVIGSSTQPGSFLINGALTSLILTNPSTTDSVDVFIASAE